MIHKASICLFIAYIVIAIAWDLFAGLAGGLHSNSWCEAARQVNRTTDGLIALCSIALWIHVFFLPWLPTFWRHG